MQRSRNQNFSLLIGYEQELKRKVQETQNLVMDNRKDNHTLNALNNLISEQQKLVTFLHNKVEMFGGLKLSNAAPVENFIRKKRKQDLIMAQIQRFKKKINQHKDYVNTYFGNNSYQSTNQYDFRKTAIIENQNLQLQTNKMTMYQNQQVQNVMGHNINLQGQTLNAGFEDHRKIRHQAQQAQGAITLIQKAIFKRKFMFFSLIVLFTIAVIIVVVRKVNKVVDFVS